MESAGGWQKIKTKDRKMTSARNEIEANRIPLRDLLANQKFHIEYFQREYKWESRNIETLVDDLIDSFVEDYSLDHKREKVDDYKGYYLGCVVLGGSSSESYSIIDGQQRITSLMLLLIHLYHLQKNGDEKNTNSIARLEPMILSFEIGDKKSFNIKDEERHTFMQEIFEKDEYKSDKPDTQTIKNLSERYEDIKELEIEKIIGRQALDKEEKMKKRNNIPKSIRPEAEEKIGRRALPYFIDWLMFKVMVVRILAKSNDKAYKIFEKMNTRGLRISDSEKLRGYVLSKIDDESKRAEINQIWKEQVEMIVKELDSENMLNDFFRSWFRAKYAEEVSYKKEIKNNHSDFIGASFYNWFKEHHEKIMGLGNSNQIYNLFLREFPFFLKCYIEIKKGQRKYTLDMPNLYYLDKIFTGYASSDPLILSSLLTTDRPETTNKKIDHVSKFIETFTMIRVINRESINQRDIKFFLFDILLSIRNKDFQQINTTLKSGIENMESELSQDAILRFKWHGKNKKFTKHLLARISHHLEKIINPGVTYEEFYNLEIEDVLSAEEDKYKEYYEDPQSTGKAIGGLLLISKEVQEEIMTYDYESKLDYYSKEEGVFAKSFTNDFFVESSLINDYLTNLGFTSYKEFDKEALKNRAMSILKICKEIWSPSHFDHS